MRTEAEAKKKWCSHAVASHTNPRAGFDGAGTPPIFPCIASACMAWRWECFLPVDGFGNVTWSATHGYCGLAGKP